MPWQSLMICPRALEGVGSRTIAPAELCRMSSHSLESVYLAKTCNSVHSRQGVWGCGEMRDQHGVEEWEKNG